MKFTGNRFFCDLLRTKWVRSLFERKESLLAEFYRGSNADSSLSIRHPLDFEINRKECIITIFAMSVSMVLVSYVLYNYESVRWLLVAEMLVFVATDTMMGGVDKLVLASQAI
jgi:hypothetical protein